MDVSYEMKGASLQTADICSHLLIGTKNKSTSQSKTKATAEQSAVAFLSLPGNGNNRKVTSKPSIEYPTCKYVQSGCRAKKRRRETEYSGDKTRQFRLWEANAGSDEPRGEIMIRLQSPPLTWGESIISAE